ncbi:hypothetical protein CLU96_3743 [Chryseobacterium sp. 52]|uniref:hypothetical protein n=1 Tax=Chryseobacterium sp. 52 TaxID=2035213 RepID=UPI000C17BBE5|nr:hypothetical protein [Chryseobacterium sp. 52]PIF46704.1 hypothetical protein CLU96_3743 [Chryseobacterium sp. 52]
MILERVIIYIPELQYECFFLGDQWKVVWKGNIKNISITTFYGHPFYIVFENVEIVSEQLIAFIDHHNVLLSDIFPLELILKCIVDNQQGYWLNLCLDFIIKMNCLNENMVRILTEIKNDKSFNQELRHKIRRIILLNNYKY